MSKSNFSDEFIRDAVRQITERGYPVSEVSQRLGVNPHSLYEWKKKFCLASGNQSNDQSEEIKLPVSALAPCRIPRDTSSMKVETAIVGRVRIHAPESCYG